MYAWNVRVCVCLFQVRAADEDRRGLLWVLDEEMVTPASCENRAVERVCQYYSNMGKKNTLLVKTWAPYNLKKMN